MSITDGKPGVVSQEWVEAWARYKKSGACPLCGKKFVAGDYFRFVYANDGNHKCANFFVCKDCDGDDVLSRADEMHALAVKLARQWGIYGPDWQ